ncbi:MAG: DNA-binding response regulator [Pseudomonadota bacterium]|jgi:two-component system nitrate/nitrite response regulator NarL
MPPTPVISSPLTPPTHRVLVIDDHPLFRRGVCQLLALEPNFEVVGEAASGEEGLLLAKSLDPDLILLDLNMKGLNGLETLQLMRDADVAARIIILTVSNAAQDLVAAIRAGSDGYILKDTDPEEMLQLLRNAMEGQDAISPELIGLLASALRKESLSEKRSQASLTERELCILKYLAAGKSNKLIARELDIMESTVKVHIRNLLKKLKFRSRVEAAVWAVSNQLS